MNLLGDSALKLAATRLLACSALLATLTLAGCRKNLKLSDAERAELTRTADISCQCVMDRGCSYFAPQPTLLAGNLSDYADEDKEFVKSTATRARGCIDKQLRWMQETNQLP